MAKVPTWEVIILVDGPVTLRRPFRTMQQKGFRPENPFYSDIQITSIPSGLRATVTARALNEQFAFEAAVFFLGRMLDVLAVRIDRPLSSSLTEREHSRNGRVRQHVRRIIDPQEIEDAFREADDLAMTEPPFLQSLSWYHKGLYTEDPLDKFLSFWIAIEIVAKRYHRSVPSIDQEQAKTGTKSQIWECFKALWGSYEPWPNIPGKDMWVDENYKVRNDLAHGNEPVNVEKVASVVDKLDIIQRVAYRFLKDWRDKLLYGDWELSSEKLPDSDEVVPI